MKLKQKQAMFVFNAVKELLENAPFLLLWADDDDGGAIHRISNLEQESVIVMLEAAKQREESK